MIVKYNLSRLWKSEYPLVVNRIIDIVEANNPHDIHLGFIFDRLAAYRPQLMKIEVQGRADRDSATLRDYDKQRDTLYKVIFSVSKAFLRTPMCDVSKNAEQILMFLKKHGSDIPVTNYTAETKRLYDLENDARKSSNIMASLNALSLKPLFDRMCKLNKEFDQIFMQRNHRFAENKNIDLRLIRKECDEEIALLWRTIEVNCKEYGKEIYMPMINEINELNTYYKQGIATRTTRNRKTKNGDNKKEEPIKPIECDVCNATDVNVT